MRRFRKRKGTAFCWRFSADICVPVGSFSTLQIIRTVLQNEINGKSVLHMNQAMDELREVQAYMETQVEMLYQRAVQMNGDAFLVKEDEMDLFSSYPKKRTDIFPGHRIDAS